MREHSIKLIKEFEIQVDNFPHKFYVKLSFNHNYSSFLDIDLKGFIKNENNEIEFKEIDKETLTFTYKTHPYIFWNYLDLLKFYSDNRLNSEETYKLIIDILSSYIIRNKNTIFDKHVPEWTNDIRKREIDPFAFVESQSKKLSFLTYQNCLSIRLNEKFGLFVPAIFGFSDNCVFLNFGHVKYTNLGVFQKIEYTQKLVSHEKDYIIGDFLNNENVNHDELYKILTEKIFNTAHKYPDGNMVKKYIPNLLNIYYEQQREAFNNRA